MTQIRISTPFLLSSCLSIFLFFPSCAPESSTPSPVLPLPQMDVSPEDPLPAPAESLSVSHPPTTVDSDDRLKTVLLQNKAAREGINAYSVDISWEYRNFEETPIDTPLPEGVVYSKGEGTWIKQGAMWRVHQRKRVDIAPNVAAMLNVDKKSDHPSQAIQEYSLLAVYDGEDFTQWNTKSEGTLYLYPAETIHAKLVDHEAFLSPHPLRFGFGVGIAFLDEIYDTTQQPALKESTRWAVDDVESDEGPVIGLTRSSSTAGGKYIKRCEYWVDPRRDFLVVYCAAWETPEEKSEVFEFDLGQLADGRWFVVEARWRRKDDYQVHRFSGAAFNGTFDPAIFSMESIPYDPQSTRMIKQGEDGDNSAYLFRDGQWIPEALVPKHLRPTRKMNSRSSKNSSATTNKGD